MEEGLQHFIVTYDNYYLIDERWAIYCDGIIYDRTKAEDIPEWVFALKDILVHKIF